MKLLVLILFLAAIVADLYIFRSLIRARFRRASARISYILFAVVTDGAALSALMLYGAAADRGSTGVQVVMWLVWLFFLALVPKLLYMTGDILDGLARLALRRPVRVFRWSGAAVAAVLVIAMLSGATAGRTKLRVEHVEICSERVPAAFDGYRILQFSDVHIGTMLCPERRIERLVETIAAQGADMVVNTGDLVNLTNDELTSEVMNILSRIDAPDGVWSVWGNHDLGFYIKEGAALTPRENFAALSEKVREMGWRTLSDRSAWIRRGGDSLLLTGIDYPTTRLNGHNNELGGADLDTAFGLVGETDPFNVVLSHTPTLWDDITARGRGDLTLSGHVHAMQTKLRILGRVWSPAQYLYEEWSGEYTGGVNGKKVVLYINDGIGCVGYPMRIGARGEITILTLKRCE
jgi:predicted MPP superfamily phosphohydrolase